MFFAKSTCGFYDLEIHGENIPADAVEITDSLYVEILEGQSNGKRISSDEKGFPTLADPLPPSDAEMWSVYQLSARSALSASDTTLMRCYEAGIPIPAEWVEYRKALRAIISAKSGDPTQPLPTRPAYPEGT